MDVPTADESPQTPPLATFQTMADLITAVYGIPEPASDGILLFREPHLEIPEHIHSYFDMLYLLSGATRHSINGSGLLLHEGDFCILPPSSRHRQSLSPDSISVRILVQPEAFIRFCPGLLDQETQLGRFLLDGIQGSNHSSSLLFHTGADTVSLHLVLDLYQEFYRKEGSSNLILAGLLMTLLARMAGNRYETTEIVPSGNLKNEILSFINQTYSTVTLEALAGHLHYTVPYCSLYLKNLFGCTFSQLLQEIRFRNAETLLRDSVLSIRQISRQLGYEDPGNFMRAFKKKYHMTPSQYRNLFK